MQKTVSTGADARIKRPLFPVDRDVPDHMTLAEVSSSGVYVWYSNIWADKTVEIVSDVVSRAKQGEQVFFPIYTEEEMAADLSKRDTGLFFFRGKSGEKFAQSRLAGSPQSDNSSEFSDVPDEAWYAGAVGWRLRDGCSPAP